MKRDDAITWIKNAALVFPPLHREVHTWAMKRSEGAYSTERWSRACATFHEKHKELAFPGGWYLARARLRSGDQDALEYALCFVEIRPYFFHTGYMFTALVKCLNSVPMTTAQRARYERVKAEYLEYTRKKSLSRVDAR